MILAFVLATSFWHYNPSSNELEYWVYGPKSMPHTCGFVSYSAPEEAGPGVPAGYMADVLESGGATEGGSKWFNTISGAKKFVENGCGAK